MSHYPQLAEPAERELVERVELRLALADTDEKFERNLDTFLAPLLLKLASPHASVKQVVFNCLQHVISRFNALSNVKIPAQKLLLQSKFPTLNPDQDSSLVRVYSLLFLSKGIERMSPDQQLDLLPQVLENISKLPESASARMFHILCKMLLSWNPPAKGTEEEDRVREFLKLKDDSDLQFLLNKFTQFFLLIPVRSDPNSSSIPRGYTCPGLSVSDVAFFTYNAGVTINKDQLTNFKKAIFKFVTSGFVPDDQMLVKFLSVASTDQSELSDQAKTMLRRLHVPYEDEDFVNYLISLFIGDKLTGTPPVSHLLQEKILSVINNSVIATKNPENVALISSIGLNSSHYKLRSLCLTFIQHVAKYNYSSLNRSESGSSDFSVNIASLIRNNLHAEGWPKLQLNSSTPNFSTALLQRRAQYETLGEILKKDFSLVSDVSFIEFLLDSLKGDLPEFRSSIQEALGSLAIHLPELPTDSKKKLKTIIRKILSDDYEIATSNPDTKEAIMSLRFIAVKFTNAAFSFDDGEARIFNILGTARNNRFDVIEESTKGLNPYWFRVTQASNSNEFKSTSELLGSQVSNTEFPSFESFVQHLFHYLAEARKYDTAVISQCLNTVTRFSLQIVVSQATLNRKTVIIQDEDWSLRVEKAIELDDTVLQLLDCEIGNFEGAWYLDFLELLTNEFVLKDERNKKVALSKFYDGNFGRILSVFVKHSSPNILKMLSRLVPRLYNYLKTYRTSHNVDIENAANIIGIIGSYPECSNFVSELLEKTDESKESPEFVPILYAIGYLVPRLFSRNSESPSLPDTVCRFMNTLATLLSDQKFKVPALKVISQFSKFGTLRLCSIEFKKDFFFTVTKLLEKNLSNDELATLAWAYLSLYAHEFNESERFSTALFGTHTSKQVEFLFTTGEAVSVLAGGWNSKFLSKQIDTRDRTFLLKSLQDKSSLAPLIPILEEVLRSCRATKPSLRKAACIWLLSIVQYLGHLPEIVSRSNEIHLAFMRFLADRDELVQESASRGLSLIYELGNHDLKEDMVKGLLKSFTDSTASMNMNSGTVSEDTELFEPGVLNTGDGSVSTYKDILNLASEVGDPSLVYKFMSLAKSSSLWSSRKGIAFGLSAIMSKSSLEDMLLKNETMAKKLIPKLFRYRFDPYQKVSKSMNDIWSTLMGNSSEAMNKYFDDILNELLEGMGNKEWRVREASTTAMIQLLQTTPLEKYDNKLELIWTMAFRSMDDIKQSVREVGNKLTQTLSNILVRSIDVNKGVKTEKSSEILDVLLPFLLGVKGLNSDAEEIRRFALKTLLNLIENTGSSIKPFVPSLVYNLTLSLSSLEPQVLNYLTLNADKYNVSASALDSRRMQSVTGSPMLNSIEKLISLCDEDLVEEMVSKVVQAAKKSVGLPSKVGASRVIVFLVLRHFTSLRSHSGKILKVCFNSLDDRNETVANSFAISLGYCFKIAGLDKVVKYSKKLSKKYFESEEQSSKKIVGIAIESVLKFSSENFENVATILMPLVFVAKNDTDSVVSDLFGKIWTEASSSGSGTVKLYLQEISELTAQHIKSTVFSTRQACAKSISQACQGADVTIGEKEIQKMFNILLEASVGRSWDGKEIVIDALVSLSNKFKDFYNKNGELQAKLRNTLMTEVSRNNKQYVKKVIFNLATYLSVHFDSELDSKLVQVGEKIFEEYETTEDSEDIKTDIGNDDDEPSNKKRPRISSDVNKKSSKDNIESEEFRVKLLKSFCAAFKFSESGYYSRDLLKFVITSTIQIFDSRSVIYTWRSQIGGSEIGSILLDAIPNNFGQELSPQFEKLWEVLYKVCGSKESIENVKIQLIRFGSKLKEKFNTLTTLVDSNLTELGNSSSSTVVKTELLKSGVII